MKRKRISLAPCLAAGLLMTASTLVAGSYGQSAPDQSVPAVVPGSSAVQAINPYEIDDDLNTVWTVPYSRYNIEKLKQKHPFYPSNIAFEDNGVPFETPSIMTCAGCHPKQYEDWQSSMHAQAFRDPIYLGELTLAIKAVGEEIRNQCEGCHTAAATVSGLGPKRGEALDFSKLGELAKAGVSCDVCHSIKKHTHWDTPSHEPENGSYVLSPGKKDAAGQNVRTKYGPFANYNGCGGGFHECVESPLHLRAELCGGCHQVFHYKEHTPLEHTYNEWKKGIYSVKGIQCQDCHMVDIPTFIRSADTFQKPQRSEYRHFFNGANFTMYFLEELRAKKLGDAKLAANAKNKYDMAVARLQAAAELDIEPIYGEDGNLRKIKVRVHNKRCGHSLPTSLTNIRQMWLEVVATDESGKELLKSGFIKADGVLDENTYLFNSDGMDHDMKFAVDPWEIVAFSRHDIIPPKGYRDVYYTTLGHEDHAAHNLTFHAKLRFRAADQKVAEKLLSSQPKGFDLTEQYGLTAIPALPVVDMVDKTITFSTKGQPSAHPVQERADNNQPNPGRAFYEQIGGEAVVNKIVDLFYDKMLADPRVNYFYDGIDMATQRRMQKNFINFALGGAEYSGPDLATAHSRLVKEKGLNDSHFDIALQHYKEALREAGVSDELASISLKVLESARADVLGKKEPAAAKPTSEPQPPPTASGPSLYDQLGGAPAIDAAVDLFYQKVLADPRVNTFFEGVDMDRQRAMQKAFLTAAFGGPNNYAGRPLAVAHARLVTRGLNDSHFDIILGHLGATLKELGVSDDLIAKAAAVANSVRDDILGRRNSGGAAAPAAATPPAEPTTSAPAPAAEASLYDQLGGAPAIDAAVDLFYQKVLADPRVNTFFEGVDMDRQRAMQKAFLTAAFGGPNNYAGRPLAVAHARLVTRGLNDSHIDIIIGYLGETLKELGVSDDLIAKAAAVANSVRDDILGRR